MLFFDLILLLIKGNMKISAEIRKKIEDICISHNIRIMAVFGSALSGSERDIDIAVYVKKGISADSVNKLELISRLESIFRKKADIVIMTSSTSTTLLYEICRNSLLLYEDENGSFEEERSLAFRKYADTHKFRQLRENNIKDFVKGVKSVS